MGSKYKLLGFTTANQEGQRLCGTRPLFWNPHLRIPLSKSREHPVGIRSCEAQPVVASVRTLEMKKLCSFSGKTVCTMLTMVAIATALARASAPQGQSTSHAGYFVDATRRLGINFRQQASPTSRKYLLET